MTIEQSEEENMKRNQTRHEPNTRNETEQENKQPQHEWSKPITRKQKMNK